MFLQWFQKLVAKRMTQRLSKRTGRPRVLPLRLEQLEERWLPTSFAGISLRDQIATFGVVSIPPDTMGAVGPNHFVESINGSFAIYAKTGGPPLSHVSLSSFFDPPGPHPYSGTTDPRILYDRPSGHWFATVLEFGQVFKKDND